MIAIETVLLIGGGVLVVIKWLADNDWTYPLLRRLMKKFRSIWPGHKRTEMLQKILSELVPNGGGSMKDTMGRIEYRIIENHRMIQIILKMQRLHEDNEGIASFLTDSNGRCIYANQNYLRLTGLTMEEVIRTGWKNCLKQENREEIMKCWAEAIDEGIDFHMEFEYKNYITDEYVPVACDAYITRDDQEEIIGWVGYIRKL